MGNYLRLIPAAGRAKRLSPLPFSKELYPIGFQRLDDGNKLHPKPVCSYLLEKMRFAGITEAYVVLRQGKWDIPDYFLDGKMLNMHLGYLIMDLPFGVPYTLDQAYPFIKDATVAFGFPDIVFKSEDAFVRLLARQAEDDADVVLGLFLGEPPHKWHMVEIDADANVRAIVMNPVQTDLRYTWIIAVWSASFSRFMHEYLKNIKLFSTK